MACISTMCIKTLVVIFRAAYAKNIKEICITRQQQETVKQQTTKTDKETTTQKITTKNADQR